MDRTRHVDGPSNPSLLGCVLGCLLLLGCGGRADVPRPPHPSLIPALEARMAGDGGAMDVLTDLGAAYREAGRMDDARRTLERAHELSPSDAAAVFFLGLTYEDLGDYARARQLYADFLSLSGPGPVRQAVENRLPLVRRRELEASARRAVEREMELADREPEEGTLAVFPFRYVGEDPELASLATAVSEFLVTDLAQTDRLTVLERLRVDLLTREMELARSGRVDPETAARSGRLLGAALVVQGQVGGDEELLDLESAVLDVRDAGGGAVDPIRSRAAAAAIVSAEKELALGIYEALGIGLTAAERERVTERQTENVQALLAYGLALEAEARGDLEEAADQFARAVEFDPGFERAVEHETRVRGMLEAMSTSTASLAWDGAATLLGGRLLDDWRLRRLAFTDLEVLVPDVVTRDPASEAFEVEGLGGRPTVLEIFFVLP